MSQTLRPGLLVSVKTTGSGNVRYDKKTLEPDRLRDNRRKAKWETTRTIFNADEHAEFVYARSRARALITNVCTASAFGLLCPEDKVRDLEAAVVAARQVADEFNDRAKLTRFGIYVITGKIAANDVEALRAINSEVRELMDEMTEGVKQLDAKAIRKAAARVRQLGAMLSKDAQERIRSAIEVARKTATEIVRAGEAAAIEVDRTALKAISTQRTAFLDLEEVSRAKRVKGKGRALDLAPRREPSPRPRQKSRQLELTE